jgi:ubiquinone/menaquinone biosynthesis C-methylase UbiE
MTKQKLTLLSQKEYTGVNRNDPLRFYFIPLIGSLYRRRVELCLQQLTGGSRVLEIGFGSGVTFLNLSGLYGDVYGLDSTVSINEVTATFRRHGVSVSLCNGTILSMPYADDYFDSVLLISILEHLQPAQLDIAFSEIRRVLRPGGQVVYGVPVDNQFMRMCFFLLGYDIRKHHFSSEIAVAAAADRVLKKISLTVMKSSLPFVGGIYQVGHYVK